MTNSLIPTLHSASSQAMLVPPDAVKDQRHRLRSFAAWLDTVGSSWWEPDLAAYRDYLLVRGLQPTSISAHLGTIRARYKALLRDNHLRDQLYALTPLGSSPADRKAFVDEVLQRLRNAADPHAASITLIQRQDQPDTAQTRLTAVQANALLGSPGVATLVGLRDTAVLATLLCTGLREGELVALDVLDLCQRFGGALAVHVRQGKGARERLVPWGALDWALPILETWLRVTAIDEGPVFRGFRHQTVRSNRLSVRAVQNILDAYPVVIEGQLVHLNPHDLRRTYARRLYEAGVDLLAISQNLGHVDPQTTLRYIGRLDVGARKPPLIYDFDLKQLNAWRTD